MIKYTIKRLGQSLLTILFIISIVFVLMRLLPTDYFFTEDQVMKWSEEQKNEVLMAYGMLDPIPVQLFRFYGDLTHFDFGESRRIQVGVPVMQVVATKFQVSMRLGLIALGIALVVGVIIGVAQAINKDGIIDHIGTGYTVFVNSVPSIVSYTLILAFGTKVLGLPTLYSTRNPGRGSILPIICLSIGSIAYYALWTRRYMVDESSKDYIKLARIKGMSGNQIMVKHVLKNAFVPLVQYIPQNILLTIGGSLLVERFFSVPGMGVVMTDAITRYDTNLVIGCVFLYCSLGIVGVFLGDVAMMLVDPRIKLTGKGETR